MRQKVMGKCSHWNVSSYQLGKTVTTAFFLRNCDKFTFLVFRWEFLYILGERSLFTTDNSSLCRLYHRQTHDLCMCHTHHRAAERYFYA